MNGDDDGRTVLITGGGSGLGAATASSLCRAGWHVAVAGRNRARLEQVAASAEGPGTISAHVVDVTDPQDLDRLIRAARPGAVVCCAAILGRGDVCNELTPERFAETMATNVGGTFHACQSAVRWWRTAGRPGDIVNVSSLAGIRGRQRFDGFVAYAASKHAVVGLTESLALETRAFDVRVNAVAPGAMRTTMIDGLGIDTTVEPEQVVPTIEFLLDRGRSGAMTGTTIEVSCDGG